MAAGDDAAGGHDDASAALVLLHMELNHALLCGDRLQLLVVDGSQVLDVYWPPLHIHQSWVKATAFSLQTIMLLK